MTNTYNVDFEMIMLHGITHCIVGMCATLLNISNSEPCPVLLNRCETHLSYLKINMNTAIEI